MNDDEIPLQEAGGLLTIDLTALGENFREVSRRVAPAACAGVVKGDAYGIGLEKAAPALWEAGARTFFVALLSEARELRALLPKAEIFVLNGMFAGTEPTYRRLNLRPVLGSVREIENWRAFCERSGEALAAAIHVDTGMNRLGLTPTEAINLAEGRHELGFPIALLMSHLACADDPNHPLTARQLEDFKAIVDLFPGVRASLANSAGAMGDAALHFDLVRPGIVIYGGRPRTDVAPLRPVLQLDLRIVQIRDVHEGETVGYGAVHTALRPLRIAIVSGGYADGIPRLAGASDLHPGAEAVVAGRRCPLVGRISMDLLAVDITDLDEEAASPGDFVTLIGKGLRPEDLARYSQTIDYEVLTSLGRRYHRRWV